MSVSQGDAMGHSAPVGLPGGGFAVAWTGSDTAPNANNDGREQVYLRLFDAAGNPLTPEILVADVPAHAWDDPAGYIDNDLVSIALLADGSLLVAWSEPGQDGDGTAVRARQDAPDGTALSDAFTVNIQTAGNRIVPDLAVLTDGSVVAAWSSDGGQDGDGPGVFARILDLPDAILGTPGDDTLTGDAGDNRIAGLEGNDLLSGLGGNDQIRGGAGLDTLLGGAGHDTLFGDDGADLRSGGTGRDDLSGGDGRDLLDGGADADTLAGGAGNDTLIGGEGEDWFVFASAQPGHDRVTDFQDNVDTLAFDDALWGGGMTVAQMLAAHAAIVGGDAVFAFEGGATTATVEGVTDLNVLLDDITLF